MVTLASGPGLSLVVGHRTQDWGSYQWWGSSQWWKQVRITQYDTQEQRTQDRAENTRQSGEHKTLLTLLSVLEALLETGHTLCSFSSSWKPKIRPRCHSNIMSIRWILVRYTCKSPNNLSGFYCTGTSDSSALVHLARR